MSNTLTGRYLLLTLSALLMAHIVTTLSMVVFFESTFSSRMERIQIVQTARILSSIETFDQDSLSLESFLNRRGITSASRQPFPTQGMENYGSDVSSDLMDMLSNSGIANIVAYSLPIGTALAHAASEGVVIAEKQSLKFYHLIVGLQLHSGDWLSFTTEPVPTIMSPPFPILMLFIFSILAMSLVAIQLARRIAKPFKELTHAADKLSAGEALDPIPLSPLVDVRRAQQAFNTMSARLQSLLKGQQHLLAAIGHDLRTPLTSLRLRLELIEDSVEQGRMRAAIDELQRLTEAALDASRTMNTDNLRVIDLASIISAAVEDIRDTGATIQWQEPQQSVMVEGWPQDLIRAFRNLIDNAVSFGQVAEVTLEADNKLCRVNILDQGPGIAISELERVFEPLVRLEDSRHRSTGGSGLGLHIVRQTITSHRGTVSLVNREDRSGLKAIVSIPIYSENSN